MIGPKETQGTHGSQFFGARRLLNPLPHKKKEAWKNGRRKHEELQENRILHILKWVLKTLYIITTSSTNASNRDLFYVSLPLRFKNEALEPATEMLHGVREHSGGVDAREVARGRRSRGAGVAA
jgi:hypothetical protein